MSSYALVKITTITLHARRCGSRPNWLVHELSFWNMSQKIQCVSPTQLDVELEMIVRTRAVSCYKWDQMPNSSFFWSWLEYSEFRSLCGRPNYSVPTSSHRRYSSPFHLTGPACLPHMLKDCTPVNSVVAQSKKWLKLKTRKICRAQMSLGVRFWHTWQASIWYILQKFE